LRFVGRAVEWQRIMAVARFIQPLVIQSVFFAIWFGADLILVNRLLSASLAGNYAAAKSLANAVYLAPSAVSGAVITRVARLPDMSLGGYLSRVMAFGVAVTIPLLLIFVIFAEPITATVFGPKYPYASGPLRVLSLGMAVYGVYLVLSGSWRGLGRPAVDAAATGAGTLATITLALLLVPRAGLMGAAVAFTSGSLVQLATISFYTVRALARGPASRLDQLMPREEAPAHE
jgi:O-antigen/teichoic acid export membrane protein